MNLKLELPKDLMLINRTDLRDVFQEVLEEVREVNKKEEIMTIKEVAEYLKVSIPTVRTFCIWLSSS